MIGKLKIHDGDTPGEMSGIKCPFCEEGLEPTNLRRDGTFNYLHKYAIGSKGCPLDGKTFSLQDLLDMHRPGKALNYCIERFKSLENILDKKSEADILNNQDLYALALQIKPVWEALKEITGTDYKTEQKQKD